MPELIFALLLLSVAIVMIGVYLNKRTSGVELHDEWVETKAYIGKTDQKKYIIIGFLVSFVIVYLVTAIYSAFSNPVVFSLQ